MWYPCFTSWVVGPIWQGNLVMRQGRTRCGYGHEAFFAQLVRGVYDNYVAIFGYRAMQPRKVTHKKHLPAINPRLVQAHSLRRSSKFSETHF